jgi:hypothetical protein
MTITDDADLSFDTAAEIDRFLSAYTPTGLSGARWQTLAPDAIALVKAAGPLTHNRVKRDIQALGAIAARLQERGRVLTLDEALADATLLDYDLALQRGNAAERTRESHRGILRRLQATHHGVPWRRDRRADGDRAKDLPSPRLVADLARVVTAAEASDDADADATALLAAVTAARQARRGVESAPTPDAATWRRARAFALQHELNLTALLLTAAVTHEVLLDARPLAVLAADAALSRRDLDLGLSHLAGLPATPSAADRAALRGAPIDCRAIATPSRVGTVLAGDPDRPGARIEEISDGH